MVPNQFLTKATTMKSSYFFATLALVFAVSFAASVQPDPKRLVVTIEHDSGECDRCGNSTRPNGTVTTAMPPIVPNPDTCPSHLCCSAYCNYGDTCDAYYSYNNPTCNSYWGQYGATFCVPSDGMYGYGDMAFSPTCRSMGCTMASCGYTECPYYTGVEVCSRTM